MTISSKLQKTDHGNQNAGLFLFPPSACLPPVIVTTSGYLRIKVERQIWFGAIKSSLLTHLGDEPFRIRDVQFN